jgi:hypothetical protein
MMTSLIFSESPGNYVQAANEAVANTQSYSREELIRLGRKGGPEEVADLLEFL